jgi:ribonuclease I
MSSPKPTRKRRPSTFVFLSHDFYRHPKVLALAHDGHHRAITTYVLALSWCGDHRTDGWIPDYALKQIQSRTTEAAQLVAVGLWRLDTGGWWIHDWLEWQDTNDDRAKRTERMRGLANLRHHGHPDGPGPTVADLGARRNA